MTIPEPSDRDKRMVHHYLATFIMVAAKGPNSSVGDNLRRAAEMMCAAAREEGRREQLTTTLGRRDTHG